MNPGISNNRINTGANGVLDASFGQFLDRRGAIPAFLAEAGTVVRSSSYAMLRPGNNAVIRAALSSGYPSARVESPNIVINKDGLTPALTAADVSAACGTRLTGLVVYGVIVDVNVPQNAITGSISFTLSGQNSAGGAISQSVVINPAQADSSGTRRARFLLLPAVSNNGLSDYSPLEYRSVAGPVPASDISIAVPGAYAGALFTYTLLTRGAPEIDAAWGLVV